MCPDSSDAKLQKRNAKKIRFASLLSNAPYLQLKNSKTKGKYLAAASDIKQGTTIISEYATSQVLLRPFLDELCAYCFSELPRNITDKAPSLSLFASKSFNGTKAIVCSGCRKQTHYCTNSCLLADKASHDYECDMIKELTGIVAFHKVDYSLFRLIIKLLVKKHLEEQDKCDPSSTFSSNSFEYVQDLVSHQKLQAPEWLECVDRASLDIMDFIPASFKVGSHLELVKLACQINSNSHGISDPNSSENSTIAIGLFPLVSMGNHSCRPNCVYFFSKGKMLLRTIQDIPSGTELTYSYVDLVQPREERRMKLLSTKFFWCVCSRCQDDGEGNDELLLNGILCAKCSDGNEILVNDSNDQGRMICSKCDHSLPIIEYKRIQTEIEKDFEENFSMFKNATYTPLTLAAFTKFLGKYSEVVHPLHHVIFNTLVTMMNICVRLGDPVGASHYCAKILNVLESSTVVPKNWPETASFLYSFAEFEEIKGKANAQQKGDIGSEVGKECLRNATKAYEKCFEMKKLLYGADLVDPDDYKLT